MFQVIQNLPLARFKRLLLNEADFSGDPVTGGKLAGVSETGGTDGKSTVTLYQGLNSIDERKPDNQVYWGWQIDGVSWDEPFNIELILEFVTATTSADDIMYWLGFTDTNSQAGWTSKGLWGGFRHSTMWKTVPFAGRYQNSNLIYSDPSYSGGQHMYLWANSPTNQIAWSNNIGVRAGDWSLYDVDIVSRIVMAPTSTSNPVYVTFTAGSNLNIPLDHTATYPADVRIWYRINRPRV